MTEERCESCEFWEGIGQLWPDSPIYGECSGDFSFSCEHCTERMKPFSNFGCIHWQEKGPDLREQLAAYMDNILSHYAPRNRCSEGMRKHMTLSQADEILAIVKGETDATSS